MKFLFKNALIYTSGELKKGEVAVDGDIIQGVGESLDFEADRVIDVKENILMPGFINAHAHTPMTLFRGVGDDLKLEEWLFEKIFPLEEKLSGEDIYWGEMLGIAEYVRAGITTFEEAYYSIPDMVRAIRKSGMRARVCIGPHPTKKLSEKEYISQWESELKLMGGNISPVLYAHSIYTITEEELELMVSFAKKHNLRLSLHLSETLKEVGDCTVKNEQTPPEYLESLGFLDRPCLAYHCVHMDKDDIRILADYDVSIATCPSSNLKLASGIAPVYTFMQNGINVAIGTDGAASNNSLDMFKEMFLVATLSKASLYDGSIVKAKEVLDMATKNGARALGLEKVGEIKKGYKADIILIDTNSPHHFPKNDLISNLVYSAKSSDVYLTMVGGKILYENGKYYIGEDIETVYNKSKETITKLLTF